MGLQPRLSSVVDARLTMYQNTTALGSVEGVEAPPICRVEVVTDYHALVALRSVWTGLAGEAGLDHPFLSHEWLCAWWESFGAGRELRVLLAKTADRVIGIAPLMLCRDRMYGLEVRRLQSIHNDHTPRADFIVGGEHREAYDALWTHLRGTRASWDVLQLSQLPAGSGTLALLPPLAARDGFRWGCWRSADSPYLPLHDTWDSYLTRLTSRHRCNLRNRLKRLGQLGEVALRDVSSLDNGGLDALEEGWWLEAAAWKGRAGTAIASRPELRQFYTRVAQRSAERGWLRLHFLTVAGRPIAFGYSLCYERRLYLLKPGYDPAYAPYSPSNLLCYLVLREAFRSGLVEYDFLGDEDDWKCQWTDDRRPHYWLFVFSDHARARLLHYVKFRLLPWLKQTHVYRTIREPAGSRTERRPPASAEAGVRSS
jgi:CelD/BcsL family acetyltransferase involved in cellulose biosynthesis